MSVASSKDAVRFLVACTGCKRQYDATGLAAGSLFHCACGEKIAVPESKAHDAAVVRCSSCGAPRAGAALSCAHCGADYSLHERDLHTICAACMTRVSDRARYCHHCGTPVLPEGEAGRRHAPGLGRPCHNNTGEGVRRTGGAGADEGQRGDAAR